MPKGTAPLFYGSAGVKLPFRQISVFRLPFRILPAIHLTRGLVQSQYYPPAKNYTEFLLCSCIYIGRIFGEFIRLQCQLITRAADPDGKHRLICSAVFGLTIHPDFVTVN